jgi:riboflavin kinase/FMN adenylyltransferase
MVKVALLGYFDFIHLGHKKLIKKIKYEFPDAKIVVYTIDYKKTSQISLEKRITNLKQIASEVVVLNFEQVKDWSPITFIQYLKSDGIKVVAAGKDYHFGKKRQGNIRLLQAHFMTISGIYRLGKNKYSTSSIKRDLLQAEIKHANKQLNEQIIISGAVVKGKQLGRTIGYKTANIIPDVVLKKGVYAVEVNVEGKKYFGMANYGVNPTVENQTQNKLEVNIFGFDQDIYGKIIDVKIIEFIRTEKKFNNLDELINQIKVDEILIKNKTLKYS